MRESFDVDSSPHRAWVYGQIGQRRGCSDVPFGRFDNQAVSAEGCHATFFRDANAASSAVFEIFKNVYSLDDSEVKLRVANDMHADQHLANQPVCDRCGMQAPGKRQWMFAPLWSTLFRVGTRREFICFRCLRVMKIYAFIGFSLLLMLVLGIVGASLWLIFVLGA